MQQADDNAGVTVHGSFHPFLLPVCLKWEALCRMGYTSSWQGGHCNSTMLRDRVSPIRFHSLSFPLFPLFSPPPHLPPCFLQFQFGERNIMQLKTKLTGRSCMIISWWQSYLKFLLGNGKKGPGKGIQKWDFHIKGQAFGSEWQLKSPDFIFMVKSWKGKN